jgi:hypothetical protein
MKTKDRSTVEREKSRQKRIDESLEKAGFKRGERNGAIGYVGTHTGGDLRYKNRNV